MRELGEPAAEAVEWEAVYWQISSMCDFVERNRTLALLHKAPQGCTRMLDFNVRGVGVISEHTTTESLAHCDLLKIGKMEQQALCNLLGISTKSLFDSCFDLMARFAVKTLILTHAHFGCHVFHGSTVSEKWGHLSFGQCTTEEAEGAFMAAYLAAQREQGRLFTDCHRLALEYMVRVCTSQK